MKLEKLAAIGEIISSVAIVVTLAYLAIQTQQNTAATASASRQHLAEMELTAYYELAELRDAFEEYTRCERSIFDFESDGIGLILTLEAWYVAKNHAWREYQNGVLDEDAWNASVAGLKNIMGFPPARSVWELAKNALNPDFVAYVESELGELLAQPPNCAA